MSNVSSQNLTDRELKFSYWYITHKLSIRKWLVVVLIIVSAVAWFYVIAESTFYAIDYGVEDYNLRRLVFGQNSYLDGLEKMAPATLSISPISVLSGESNRHDFFAEVANPNQDWFATFNYKFATAEVGGEIRPGFILPAEKKFLMGLGLENSASGLEITDLKWRRIVNFEKIKNERLRFTVANEEFIGGAAAGDPNIVTFDLTNASAYNYWEAGVAVFLWSGSELVGVNHITLNQIKTGETKKVELNWSNQLPRIDDIQVIPDVNILDENNIMPQDSPAAQ